MLLVGVEFHARPPFALQEEKDNFCNAVRAEVKAAGLLDTQSACWAFFIEKARSTQVTCQGNTCESDNPLEYLGKAWPISECLRSSQTACCMAASNNSIYI